MAVSGLRALCCDAHMITMTVNVVLFGGRSARNLRVPEAMGRWVADALPEEGVAQSSTPRGRHVRAVRLAASAARMAGPPGLSEWRRCPAAAQCEKGRYVEERASVSIRMTPAWRSNCVRRHVGRRAPVCDVAAREPALRPLLRARTSFVAETAGEPGELTRVPERFQVRGRHLSRGPAPVLDEVVAENAALTTLTNVDGPVQAACVVRSARSRGHRFVTGARVARAERRERTWR
jgi:hypothetical protein